MSEMKLLDEMIAKAETLVATLKEARQLQSPSAILRVKLQMHLNVSVCLFTFAEMVICVTR
jgi:hypothetical protein